MSRKARLTGEYIHVIVRGIGKQILFEDDEDHLYYLSILQRYRDECRIGIIVYCMMENHVHLLLHDPEGNISVFMKKMGVNYARHYNEKYDRIGHLFQDRYKSEIIKNEQNLLAVFRYILNNPRKAGIAKSEYYKWSSYHEYGKKGCLTDSSMISAMIGSKSQMNAFLKNGEEEEFMEEVVVKHDDDWAKGVISRILDASSGTVLQQMPKPVRDEMLVKLKAAGLSVRQIERLTGINRGVIQKAK